MKLLLILSTLLFLVSCGSPLRNKRLVLKHDINLDNDVKECKYFESSEEEDLLNKYFRENTYKEEIKKELEEDFGITNLMLVYDKITLDVGGFMVTGHVLFYTNANNENMIYIIRECNRQGYFVNND